MLNIIYNTNRYETFCNYLNQTAATKTTGSRNHASVLANGLATTEFSVSIFLHMGRSSEFTKSIEGE